MLPSFDYQSLCDRCLQDPTVSPRDLVDEISRHEGFPYMLNHIGQKIESFLPQYQTHFKILALYREIRSRSIHHFGSYPALTPSPTVQIVERLYKRNVHESPQGSPPPTPESDYAAKRTRTPKGTPK
jgi:hypothetical protein